MADQGAKILVVEDETSQLELLAYNLEFEGYRVFKAETAEEGQLILAEQDIDLVLLDWMLPQTSGLELCRQIKRSKATQAIPVIMLTARGEEEDKVRGLDTGADDYVVKPYSIRELMARVRSGLRQTGGHVGGDMLVHDGLAVDLARHRVILDGAAVELGRLEFKLLVALLEQRGRVLSRDQLLDRVWGDNLNVDTRTVDVHVGRLRKQLSRADGDSLIRTVRGFGYSFDDQD